MLPSLLVPSIPRIYRVHAIILTKLTIAFQWLAIALEWGVSIYLGISKTAGMAYLSDKLPFFQTQILPSKASCRDCLLFQSYQCTGIPSKIIVPGGALVTIKPVPNLERILSLAEDGVVSLWDCQTCAKMTSFATNLPGKPRQVSYSGPNTS